MHHTLLDVDETGGRRRFMLVLEPGEDPYGVITDFAVDQGLTAASLTGIGALSEVTYGWFDPVAEEYSRTTLTQQVEVASLVGNVTVNDGEPFLHAHITLTSPTQAGRGGHLFGGRVDPTLEVTITETPATLRRSFDDEIGLAVIDSSASDPGASG